MDERPAAGITAVALAGGRSRRFGRDKALEPFGGEPLLHRVSRRLALATQAAETLVVVSDPERARELPLLPGQRLVYDAVPGCGPLGGIFAALLSSRTEWVCVAACDMPFLSAPLLRRLAERRAGVDAVAPAPGGRPEPTHALYSRRCLPAIARRLRAGELKTAAVFADVRTRYLDEDEIRRYDPNLTSCCNVNRAEDLAQALALAGQF